MLRYAIAETPARDEYIRQDGLDTINSMTYGRKVYGTTQSPTAFDAIAGGTFFDLLLESGTTDALLLESGTTDRLNLESSSSITTSLVYLMNTPTPVFFAGCASGKSSGSDQQDLSLVFKGDFFRPGDVMIYEANGTITENAANTSLAFTVTFPDTGTAVTVAMPTTVSQDALSDWKLRVISAFGFNSSGNGIVTHSGELQVANTDESNGISIIPIMSVTNTLNYGSVLYYKPQVAWNTQNSGSDSDFSSAYLTIT